MFFFSNYSIYHTLSHLTLSHLILSISICVYIYFLRAKLTLRLANATWSSCRSSCCRSPRSSACSRLLPNLPMFWLDRLSWHFWPGFLQTAGQPAPRLNFKAWNVMTRQCLRQRLPNWARFLGDPECDLRCQCWNCGFGSPSAVLRPSALPLQMIWGVWWKRACGEKWREWQVMTTDTTWYN